MCQVQSKQFIQLNFPGDSGKNDFGYSNPTEVERMDPSSDLEFNVSSSTVMSAKPWGFYFRLM